MQANMTGPLAGKGRLHRLHRAPASRKNLAWKKEGQMLIIWEVKAYPGAWASALMQPINKAGEKNRHSPVSSRGIYLLNTLTKLFEGLIEARLYQFIELNDTLTPSQQGSRIIRQTHDAFYSPDKPRTPFTRCLLPPYNSNPSTDLLVTAAFIDARENSRAKWRK